MKRLICLILILAATNAHAFGFGDNGWLGFSAPGGYTYKSFPLQDSVPADWTFTRTSAQYLRTTTDAVTSVATGVIGFEPTCWESTRMVAIGDSITNSTGGDTVGFRRALEDVYGLQSTLPMVNKGIGGQTLEQMEARFQTDVVQLTPKRKIVTILGGTNNVSNADTDPNDSARAAMISMISQARAAGITPIVGTIPPWATGGNWNEARQGYTESYNTWLRQYCADNSVQMFDTYEALRDPGLQTLQAAYDSGDHIHPNRAGYDRIAVAMLPEISKLMVEKAYVSETSAINLALWSQDFTNAAWVHPNITHTANTLTAPDGTLTADTIASTAPNATILQTITAAASSHTFSVYLQRKTGTGTVEITTDGVTWVDVTNNLHVGLWSRPATNKVLTAIPVTFGIRLGTSGDAVYAWQADMVATASVSTKATSPIPTTTTSVTRQIPYLRFPVAGVFPANDFTIYFEFVHTAYTSTRIAGTFIDATHRIIVSGGVNKIQIDKYPGPVSASHTNAASASYVEGEKYKVILRQTSTDGMAVFVNGVKGAVTSADTTAWPFGTTFAFGADGQGTTPTNARISNIRIYKNVLSDERCVGLTTP